MMRSMRHALPWIIVIGCGCVAWETLRYQATTSYGFQLGDNLLIVGGTLAGLVLLLANSHSPEPTPATSWRWLLVMGVFGVGVCIGIIAIFFYRPQPILWQTALLLGACWVICLDTQLSSAGWQMRGARPYYVWGVILMLWVTGTALQVLVAPPPVISVGIAAFIGIMIPGLSLYLGFDPDAHLFEALLWAIPIGISLYLVVLFWLERLALPVSVTTFNLIGLGGIALGVLCWQLNPVHRSFSPPSKSASGDESPDDSVSYLRRKVLKSP